jgi:putative FmdB family regulatory protein
MPIYEYRRPDGSTFEIVQSFSDESLTHDPESGVAVQRVLHAPAVHFKGKGFYNTDYGTRKRQRENAAASAESSSSESSGGESGGSGEKSGEQGTGDGGGSTDGASAKGSASEGKSGEGKSGEGKSKAEKSGSSSKKSEPVGAKR